MARELGLALELSRALHALASVCAPSEPPLPSSFDSEHLDESSQSVGGPQPGSLDVLTSAARFCTARFVRFHSCWNAIL